MNSNKPFYGWGASACWWSDDISDKKTRTEIAKLLYSEEGLGLNIYRYNIGGGFDPENNVVENKWRLNESFYVLNEKTGEYEYDFSRDANAQAMLKESLSYGCIDTVILFANSPHYSMCANGRSSGANDGLGNIEPEMYEAYTKYFLDITEYFIADGIPVKYVSPINEPQWTWGKDNYRQEGCHYEKEEVLAVFEIFAKEITKRGLNVKLYGPESGNISNTTKTYYKMLTENELINQMLGAFAYHSYGADDDYVKKLKFGNWKEKNVPTNLRFDMSEWCELPTRFAATDVKSALIMARVISQDIDGTGVDSWTAWVAINQKNIKEDGLDYSDGLLITDQEDMTDYNIAYRYYAMKHYSAFIKAGSVMLDTDESLLKPVLSDDDDKILVSNLVNTAAFEMPNGDIVIVVVNEGEGRNIKFGLKDYNEMTIYTTDEEKKCENTYIGEYQEEITVSQNSINTFVFS